MIDRVHISSNNGEDTKRHFKVVFFLDRSLKQAISVKSAWFYYDIVNREIFLSRDLELERTAYHSSLRNKLAVFVTLNFKNLAHESYFINDLVRS